MIGRWVKRAVMGAVAGFAWRRGSEWWQDRQRTEAASGTRSTRR